MSFDSLEPQPIVPWQRCLGERRRCFDAAGKLGARGDPAASFSWLQFARLNTILTRSASEDRKSFPRWRFGLVWINIISNRTNYSLAKLAELCR